MLADYLHHPVLHRSHFRQHRMNRVRDHVHRVAARHVACEDHEFVAAEARDCIGGPHPSCQRIREGLQQDVADFVAVGIVDLLEAIEIDQQQRRRTLCPVDTAVTARPMVCSGVYRLLRPVSGSVPARSARSRFALRSRPISTLRYIDAVSTLNASRAPPDG